MGVTGRAAVVIAIALAGCSPRPAPAPEAASPPAAGPASATAVAPVRTDADAYAFVAGEFGPELRIASTFSAPATGAVHIANCNGAFSWRLQKREGDAWVDAWVPAMDACLSAPLVVPAGGTHSSTHLVRAGAGAALRPVPPGVELQDGTYRLVWDGVATPAGADLAETLRVSSPFAVSRTGG